MADQDVMQQFEAIRSRLQGPQPAVETVAPTTAEPQPSPQGYVRVPFEDETGKTPGVVAYSTVGKQTPEAFMQAYSKYQKDGNTVPGFTFLQPGLVESARSSYESVNRPLQEGAQSLDATMSNVSQRLQQAVTPSATPANAAFNAALPQGRTTPNTASLLASTVDTPEKAGATAGMIATTALTGGWNFLPKVLMAALGAGGGAGIADVATGTNEGRPKSTLSTMLLHAGIAALSQGILGGFQQLIGKGFSQKANQQVAGDIMNMLKKEAAPFTNDSTALQAFTSDKVGADKLIVIGVKGLRGDIDAIGSKVSADQFVADFSTSAPRALSKKAATDVKGYIRQLGVKGNELLDNMDDSKITARLQGEMRDLRQKVQNSISTDFSKSSPTVRAAQELRAKQLVDQYAGQVDKFADAAEVLHEMKMSVGPQGFDPLLLQKRLQFKSGKNPGSVMDQAGDAAFRGAEDRLAGADSTITKGVPFVSKALKDIPYLNKIPLTADVGTRHVGNVRGSYPISEATAAQTTVTAIKDFLQPGGKYRSKDKR